MAAEKITLELLEQSTVVSPEDSLQVIKIMTHLNFKIIIHHFTLNTSYINARSIYLVVCRVYHFQAVRIVSK